jgi:hypothetical protein
MRSRGYRRPVVAEKVALCWFVAGGRALEAFTAAEGFAAYGAAASGSVSGSMIEVASVRGVRVVG